LGWAQLLTLVALGCLGGIQLTRGVCRPPTRPPLGFVCCVRGASRVECLDELCYMVRETGYRTVGRKGLQKIATLIGTGEKEVRDAAIDVMEALWIQVRSGERGVLQRAERPARTPVGTTAAGVVGRGV
jgi:hypothetical protein